MADPIDGAYVYRLVLRAHWDPDKQPLANALWLASFGGPASDADIAGAMDMAVTHWINVYAGVTVSAVHFDSLELQDVQQGYMRVYHRGLAPLAGLLAETAAPRAMSLIIKVLPTEPYGRSQRNRFYSFGAPKAAIDNLWPFFLPYYIVGVIAGVNYLLYHLGVWNLALVVYSPKTGLAYFVAHTDNGALAGTRNGRRAGHGRR